MKEPGSIRRLSLPLGRARIHLKGKRPGDSPRDDEGLLGQRFDRSTRNKPHISFILCPVKPKMTGWK